MKRQQSNIIKVCSIQTLWIHASLTPVLRMDVLTDTWENDNNEMFTLTNQYVYHPSIQYIEHLTKRKPVTSHTV